MSGFALVPLAGGAAVLVPPGETVLGRGHFLGVSDKRVSRHHGLLEHRDGQLLLKPTHVNPCFVQSSPSNAPRRLQRSVWTPLHHGDVFSLLPGSLKFRVEHRGDAHRNTQISGEEEEEEEEELPVSPPSSGQTDQEENSRISDSSSHKKGSAHSKEEEEEVKEEEEEVKEEEEEVKEEEEEVKEEVKEEQRGGVPLSTPKRRVLPAWMRAVSSTAQPVGRGSKAAATPSGVKRAAAKKVTPEEGMPRKRRRKTVDEEEEEEEEEEAAAQSRTDFPSRCELSDESNMEVDEDGGETPKNGRQAAKRVESVGSNGRARAPCPYGKDCYRKNPVHFQECSHPGDTDYKEQEDEEDEEDEDRPECIYGTDCYRKNPQHRKEYKHTKKPASTRRAVPKKAPNEDEDGDGDCFIDDDSFSEGGGEDSDYEPPETDDSGKEDIKRLQREAKAFLKKRK